MGYYTQYKFTKIEEPSVGIFRTKLELAAGGEIPEDDTCKWYEHDANITSAMIASGTTAVDLHGVGEESGDVWDKEFRMVDGKKVTIRCFRYRLVRDTEPS